MQVIRPNGMVEHFNEHHKRPQLRGRYGRRKEGAPRDERALMIATDQDRRSESRDVIDPLRGHLLDLTA